MNELNGATRRGTVLNGALFLSPVKAGIFVIAIPPEIKLLKIKLERRGGNVYNTWPLIGLRNKRKEKQDGSYSDTRGGIQGACRARG